MGKIHFIDYKEGYEYISDRGYKYDLLEGMSLGGETTSDIVFIKLSYDEELTEKVETEFVGYFYGAAFAIRDYKETEELIGRFVDEYETKMNLKGGA